MALEAEYVSLLYADPTNWSRTYRTFSAEDPNVPAGYVLQSTPIAIDPVATTPGDGRPSRAYGYGAYSGGWPQYGNQATDDNSRPSV
jgi:hypothetical protein